MPNPLCFASFCFVPLSTTSDIYFGFEEFLGGLALLVIAWTIADFRYRFRVMTAPIPLIHSSFYVVGAIGILTLLTELWRSEGWLVPQTSWLTIGIWQGFLAGSFLLTFLTWSWFAFISPPVYGRGNCLRFARIVYSSVVKASPEELRVIADEITRSVPQLVKFATNREPWFRDQPKEQKRKIRPVEGCACDIFNLLGDPTFCEEMVASAPGTIEAIFDEMDQQKRLHIPVKIMARNIVGAALRNPNSFLYRETNFYESGLIGHIQPITNVVFSNYRLVEAVDRLLDARSPALDDWKKDQLEAYCRITLMVLKGYIGTANGTPSFLYRAFRNIQHATRGISTLRNNLETMWENDTYQRLQVAVEFLRDAIELLDEQDPPLEFQLISDRDIDHLIAKTVFEIIHSAASIKEPFDQVWFIQHNTVWSEFFTFDNCSGTAGRIIKKKILRMMADRIRRMRSRDFPNFQGARLLRFSLTVMGLKESDEECFRDHRAYHRLILHWIKQNYRWLHAQNPEVAAACLPLDMSFDEEANEIVKTVPARGLRRQGYEVRLALSSPECGD